MFAQKLITLRKEKGWSQEELAQKLNVSRQSVSKWESMASMPDIDKIIILSDIFDVSTDYLLKNIENNSFKKSEYNVIQQPDTIEIPLEQAIHYIFNTQKSFKKISLSVLLFILSIAQINFLYLIAQKFYMFYYLLSNISTIIFIVFAIYTIFVFIRENINLKKYNQILKQNPFYLLPETLEKIEEQKYYYQNEYNKNRSIGIVFCILSIIPFLSLNFLYYLFRNDIIFEITVVLFFVFIAIGIYLILESSLILKSYNKILNMQHTVNNHKTSEQKNIEKLGFLKNINSIGFFYIYFSVVISIYLIISFYNEAWLLIPISVILFPSIIILKNIYFN